MFDLVSVTRPDRFIFSCVCACIIDDMKFSDTVRINLADLIQAYITDHRMALIRSTNISL